jgi:hypothetical protein
LLQARARGIEPSQLDSAAVRAAAAKNRGCGNAVVTAFERANILENQVLSADFSFTSKGNS